MNTTFWEKSDKFFAEMQKKTFCFKPCEKDGVSPYGAVKDYYGYTQLVFHAIEHVPVIRTTTSLLAGDVILCEVTE